MTRSGRQDFSPFDGLLFKAASPASPVERTVAI